jgi:hypothetical protein
MINGTQTWLTLPNFSVYECRFSPTICTFWCPFIHFRNFDIAEVIFFRKAKCSPVEIVFEYVFDRERGIGSKTEENDEKACSECEDVRMHQLDVWLEGYDN